MMKKNFHGLYLFLIISIIILCVSSCTQTYEIEQEGEEQQEESKSDSDENAVAPIERIDVGDGEVCFYTDEDGFLLTIKSKSDETINSLLVMSPIEIYEKYKGEAAPEDLVKIVEESGYEPVPETDIGNNEINLSQELNRSTFTDLVEFFRNYYGDRATLDHSVAYGTSSDSYKKKVGGSLYLIAAVYTVSGNVQHRMRRRVIRAFKSNYWTTIASPLTVYAGETIVARATYSKSREITSDIINVNGTYHHCAGYRSYY